MEPPYKDSQRGKKDRQGVQGGDAIKHGCYFGIRVGIARSGNPDQNPDQDGNDHVYQNKHPVLFSSGSSTEHCIFLDDLDIPAHLKSPLVEQND